MGLLQRKKSRPPRRGSPSSLEGIDERQPVLHHRPARGLRGVAQPKSTALPKALSHLREATDKHLVTLRGLAADMKTDAEKSALREAIGEAEIANNGARQGLK